MSENRVPGRYEFARRIIYLLVALAVILPFFIPLKQQFTPSEEVKKVFEKVDSLQPGDQVLMSFDYEPASEAELYPMSLALLRHCFRKGVIPVVLTHWPAGVGLSKNACEEAAADIAKETGKEYLPGRDYVFLGYRPGMTNVVLKMVDNVKEAFESDIDARPTRGMKALEGADKLEDFELLVDLAAGATVEMWIAYGADRAGIPMAAGTTAVMAPDLYPFYQSGQLIGFLGGLRGAADYEKLIEYPDRGEKGMLAQSATHVLIIVLILYANVHMFAKRYSRKART
jgi:hypothetical protein